MTINKQARPRVTLLDVAKDAQVSRSTVSLVLRNSPLVAGKTRQRVLESFRRLGYIYHRSAASLRTQRSDAVGLIITDLANPFFAELASSLPAKSEIVRRTSHALIRPCVQPHALDHHADHRKPLLVVQLAKPLS